jgi:hypothetical protein
MDSSRETPVDALVIMRLSVAHTDPIPGQAVIVVQALTGDNSGKVARSERLELPTLCFEGRCSIQLSYERVKSEYSN